MQVIAYKRLHFQKIKIATHKDTKERVAIREDSHTVTPSPTPQLAPDWIKQDGLFDAAIADGSLIEVTIVKAKKQEPAAESTEEQPKVVTTGWGTKPVDVKTGLPQQ